MSTLIFVDCEAPLGVGAPSVGDMTEFGAVKLTTHESFHGKDCSLDTFVAFKEWLAKVANEDRLVFVSDNPAYDWQWINYYFWRYFGANPFGHSARRIGDFYAGLKSNFWDSNSWKSLRETPHDHNPVNDALGNAEAFEKLVTMAKAKGATK